MHNFVCLRVKMTERAVLTHDILLGKGDDANEKFARNIFSAGKEAYVYADGRDPPQ